MYDRCDTDEVESDEVEIIKKNKKMFLVNEKGDKVTEEYDYIFDLESEE